MTGDRVLLRLNVEAATHDRQDRFAGLPGGLGEFVDQAAVVVDQRGAIRMPPSRRMAAAFIYGFSIRKQASWAYSSG